MKFVLNGEVEIYARFVMERGRLAGGGRCETLASAAEAALR